MIRSDTFRLDTDLGTVCLARVQYGSEEPPDALVEVCLLECCIENEDGSKEELNVLEAEFFDDECVVIVYRLRGEDGKLRLVCVRIH